MSMHREIRRSLIEDLWRNIPSEDSVSAAGGKLNKLTLPGKAMLLVLRQMDGDTYIESSSLLTELGPGFPNAVWKEIAILTTMEKELYRNKSTSNKNSNNKQSMLVWRGEVGKVSWNPFLWCPQVHAPGGWTVLRPVLFLVWNDRNIRKYRFMTEDRSLLSWR